MGSLCTEGNVVITSARNDDPGAPAATAGTSHPQRRPAKRLDQLDHVPALDGLRGIAVAAVLLYHNDFGWARGGFLGVSAFFTLSGFLITTRLLQTHHTQGSIGYVDFLRRRFRRLLPAAVVTLALILIVALLHGWTIAQRSGLRAELPASLLDVANWQLAFSSRSYAALFSDPSPVHHFWSLAIEEQFYFVFPLVLAVLLRVIGRRRTRLALALGAGAVASAVWGAYLSTRVDLDRVYLGTDTRMAELLVGSVLAVLLFQRHRRGGRAAEATFTGLSVVAAAGLVLAWHQVSLGSLDLYQGGLLAHAAAIAVLIAAAVRVGPVAKVLSLPPLVALGRISYGVYLLHWPIYLLLTPERLAMTAGAAAVVRIGAALIAAVVMFYAVEQPVRLRRGAVGARIGPVVLAVVAVAMLVATPLSLPHHDSAGASTRFEGGIPDPPDSHDPGDSPGRSEPADAGGVTVTVTPVLEPYRIEIVGDSVAHGLALEMYRHSDPTKVQIIDGTSGACGTIREGKSLIITEWVPYRPLCVDWQGRLERYRPDAVLVMRTLADLSDHLIDGKALAPGSAAYARRWSQQYGADLQQVIDSGATVIAGAPTRVLSTYGGSASSPARFTALTSLVRSVAASKSVTVLDLQGVLDHLGIVTRVDGIHLSEADNATVAAAVLPTLLDAAKARRTAEAATGGSSGPGTGANGNGNDGSVTRPTLVIGPESVRPVIAELQAKGVNLTDGLADCPLDDQRQTPQCGGWRQHVSDWANAPGTGTIVVFPFDDRKIWGVDPLEVINATDAWLTGLSGPDVAIRLMPRAESLLAPPSEQSRAMNQHFDLLQRITNTRTIDVPIPSAPAQWSDAIITALLTPQ